MQSRIGRRKDAAAWPSIGHRVENPPNGPKGPKGPKRPKGIGNNDHWFKNRSTEKWNAKEGKWARTIVTSALIIQHEMSRREANKKATNSHRQVPTDARSRLPRSCGVSAQCCEPGTGSISAARRQLVEKQTCASPTAHHPQPPAHSLSRRCLACVKERPRPLPGLFPDDFPTTS